MEKTTKDYLDKLTIEELKSYISTRTDVAWHRIRSVDSFVDELNDKYDMNLTKEQWEKACLDGGIQNFNYFAYDFYDAIDDNGEDDFMWKDMWEQMVDDELEELGVLKKLRREKSLDFLLK